MLSSLWKKKTALMVGLDIGSYAAKAVLINQTEDGYKLEALAIEPMPRGAVVDREIQDIDAVGHVIAKIKKKLASPIKQAAAAVSGQTVISKVIYMDVVLDEHELASQIEIEADTLIPYPLDEVSLDFEVLAVNETDPSKNNVLLSAARTESVAARASALEVGGFSCKVVDVESYAISRSYDLILSSLPEGAENKVVALVDIGATMMLFSVTDAGEHLYSRDQLFGGEQYTRSIASYYGKAFEEAEQAKITQELPENYQAEVLVPFQTILVQQVRRAIQMFITASGKESIDYLVISGGSSFVEGLDTLLAEELAIPTVLANPFGEMQVAEQIEQQILEKHAPQFMVATGLALRSFIPWHI